MAEKNSLPKVRLPRARHWHRVSGLVHGGGPRTSNSFGVQAGESGPQGGPLQVPRDSSWFGVQDGQSVAVVPQRSLSNPDDCVATRGSSSSGGGRSADFPEELPSPSSSGHEPLAWCCATPRVQARLLSWRIHTPLDLQGVFDTEEKGTPVLPTRLE